MAKKGDQTEKPDRRHESVLVEAARKIGGIAGGIAGTVGAHVHHEASGESNEPTADQRGRKGKLPKKNKQRLPRRVKKEMRKKDAAAHDSRTDA